MTGQLQLLWREGDCRVCGKHFRYKLLPASAVQVYCSHRCRFQRRKKELRDKLTAVFGLVCWYCGLSLIGQKVEQDHIIPRCKGGTDKDSNMALACVFCNQAKGDRPLVDFLAWLDQVRSMAWRPIRDRDFGSNFPPSCAEVGETSSMEKEGTSAM